MNCKNCGKDIDPNLNFCPSCGASVKDAAIAAAVTAPPVSENSSKKYGSTFLLYFLMLIIASSFSYGVSFSPTFLFVYLVAMATFLVFFCILVGQAMNSIGKKNWWPLGLLAFVPFGFWITYFVVRSELKPAGKWGKDLVWLIIILIVPTAIAIMGIFAGMVLVSMSGARSKARDARRESDMRQLAAAQQMWRASNGRYYTCEAAAGDCRGATNNYPAAIGDYLRQTPEDPMNNGKKCGTDYIYCGFDNTADSGANFCYYAKLENGGFYLATPNGNYGKESAPVDLNYCLSSPGLTPLVPAINK